MKVKLLVLIIMILVPLAVSARSLELFTTGLSELLHFKSTGRIKELQKHTNLAPFSKVDKILSPSAEAIYNGKLNLIKVDGKVLRYNDGRYYLKSAIDLVPERTLVGTTLIVTIFHEIAHAEMDILIENKKSINDLVLINQYNNSIKELVRRNFTYDSWTFFHEYFAYYRTDLLESLFWDKHDIYFNNGFDTATGKCRLNKSVQSLLDAKVSKKDFLKFYPFDPSKSYKKAARPKYVFVKGKDYDLSKLSKADKEIIEKTNDLFWMYHLEEYGVPTTQAQFVERMNQSDLELDRYQKCRSIIYDKYNN